MKTAWGQEQGTIKILEGRDWRAGGRRYNILHRSLYTDLGGRGEEGRGLYCTEILYRSGDGGEDYVVHISGGGG